MQNNGLLQLAKMMQSSLVKNAVSVTVKVHPIMWLMKSTKMGFIFIKWKGANKDETVSF